jgi:hypothetical protein
MGHIRTAASYKNMALGDSGLPLVGSAELSAALAAQRSGRRAAVVGAGCVSSFHLVWEVRKLLMLLITPGVDSVCFNVSRLQHKCSWCSVMAVVQHNAVG